MPSLFICNEFVFTFVPHQFVIQIPFIAQVIVILQCHLHLRTQYQRFILKQRIISNDITNLKVIHLIGDIVIKVVLVFQTARQQEQQQTACYVFYHFHILLFLQLAGNRNIHRLIILFIPKNLSGFIFIIF